MADQESIKSRGREMLPQFPLAPLEVHYAEFNRVRCGKHRGKSLEAGPRLLQLRVFGLGLLRDGDVGIGVFDKEPFALRNFRA
jgi:hypothetical protein